MNVLLSLSLLIALVVLRRETNAAGLHEDQEDGEEYVEYSNIDYNDYNVTATPNYDYDYDYDYNATFDYYYVTQAEPRDDTIGEVTNSASAWVGGFSVTLLFLLLL